VRTRLNLEMAASQEMLRLALTVKPEQVTLVPERLDELTTEGGLDVVLNSVQLKPVVKTLAEGGIEVSMFVDPDLEQVKESHKLDARAVEINTAAYADARDDRAREAALRKVVDTAGHGLTYANVGAVAGVSEISELNIGHNIVARAVLVGMERAVREMVAAMAAGQPRGLH
jgi:pyridoxine 5-phosphate synthase